MKTKSREDYKYILKEDFHCEMDLSNLFTGTDITEFKSKWGKITPKGITIYAEYAWDGCSGNVWQGETIVPEPWMPVVYDNGERYTDTLAASLVHDYFYQFLFDIRRDSGYSLWKIRKVADQAFYHILIRANFKCSRLYYIGVRLLGPITYVRRCISAVKRKI